jgi:hypothetical protein
MKKSTPIWNLKPTKRISQISKKNSIYNPTYTKKSLKSKSIQPISFMKPVKITSLNKRKNNSNPFALTPAKSFGVKTSISPFLGIPKTSTKKTNKKNMDWYQAKKRYPKLNPYSDADRDGVPNIIDCKPFNSKRHGIISSIGSSISKAYTNVDRAVGGILPGGAPSSSAPKTTYTATPVPAKTSGGSSTSTGSSSSSSTKSSGGTSSSTKPSVGSSGGSGGGSGGGSSSSIFETPTSALTPALTSTKPSVGTSTSQSSSVSTKPSVESKVYYSSTPGWKPSDPSATVIYIDKSGKTTGQSYGTTSSVAAGIDVTATGKTSSGGYVNIGSELVKVTKNASYTPDIKSIVTPRENIQQPTYQSEAAIEQARPLNLGEINKILQPLAAQKSLRPEVQGAIPTIAGAVEITPEELPYLLQTKAKSYPMILNLNPLEKKRPSFVTSELLRLNPRITYNKNMPTRLSILAPVGTEKEVQMTGAGATGRYAEYVIKMPEY